MAEIKLTPMLAQYQSVKKEHPDSLLLFRIGDFYELFFEDAITASRELQLALTTRGKGASAEAPMCGVPYHAARSYISQLIDRGYSVAICDQIEDPKLAKGLVKRAITSIITPGTVLEEGSLAAKNHNYLGAVFCGLNDSSGFAWADVSTGQWSGLEFRRQQDLWHWVRKISPAELLLMDGQQPPASANLEGIRIVRQPALNFELKRASERVLSAQGVQEAGALGLEDKPGLMRACGAILAYLEQTQMGSPAQLMPFAPFDTGKRMLIDEFTERNLEIFQRLNGQKGKGTLRHLLDDTITPMGGRLLEDMLHHPYRDLRIIRRAQQAVGWFYENDPVRANLRAQLTRTLDIERIIIRISMGRATPRDFLSLRQSLDVIPAITGDLMAQGLSTLPRALADLLVNLADTGPLAEFLHQALADEAPQTANEGGVFRQGYNAELDVQLDLLEHGEQKLQALLKEDQERSGMPKLRLGFNRVFGYYYEAPRSNIKNGIPDYFIRRQSLANGERYTTEDLKKLEEDIFAAADKRKQLESEMFANLREHVAGYKDVILQTADMLACVDYWQALAEVARREIWCMPELTEEAEIHISEGRHPVVEAIAGRNNFVPNDFHMDSEHRLCLLTGPNMAGKSTILRQVALICLLAQMGSMVPASSARLGLVDRLFSRVGASDNLAQGQSTFMVEMMETARILRQSTRRSLIILDEIGRGTGTFDGMAIAWAVVEELAARCQKQLRTIFATHYHELTSLEQQTEGVFTMNIAVSPLDNKEILFLHRLVPGPSDKSYGVEVARLAGVPYPVVQRARELLNNLEQTRAHVQIRLELPGLSRPETIEDQLRKLDLASISGQEALEMLAKWQKELPNA